MKLETHCHSLGGSLCAKADVETIIQTYKDAGFGGIVLTNHFVEKHYINYPGQTKKEKLDFYFSLFDNLKEVGVKQGVKVFLGAEISACTSEEYLLYGFDRSLFYDNELLFKLNQKELYEFAQKNGCFLYQAHPFRDRVKVLGDPKYMHGAESFNGHYHHVNENYKANEFCEKNHLIKMSGTDFHDVGQPVYGGIIVPDYVENEKQLTQVIFSGEYQLITNQESYTISLNEFLEKKARENKCK